MEGLSGDKETAGEQDSHARISNPVSPTTTPVAEKAEAIEAETNSTSPKNDDQAADSSGLQKEAAKEVSENTGNSESEGIADSVEGSKVTDSENIAKISEPNESNMNVEDNKTQDSLLADEKSGEEQISKPTTVEEQESSKDEPEKIGTENEEVATAVHQTVHEEVRIGTEIEESSTVVDQTPQEQEKILAENEVASVDQAVEEQGKLTNENEEVTTVDQIVDEQEKIATGNEKVATDEQEKIAAETKEQDTVSQTVDEEEQVATETKNDTSVDQQEKLAPEEVTTVDQTVDEQEKMVTETEEVTTVEQTVDEQEKMAIENEVTTVPVPQGNTEKDSAKSDENAEKTAESVLESAKSQEQSDNLNEEGNEKSSAEQNDKGSAGEETERRDDEQTEQNSEDENRENPIFVHVNTEKEDDGKGDKTTEQELHTVKNIIEQEDEDFQNSQPQEDPIAADATIVEDPKDNIEESEQGADEELCIIPDTERVISQEEKDAASALLPMQTDLGDTAVVTESNFLVTTCTDESLHSCIQCLLPRKAKYISTTEQRTLYICDDNCLKAFKEDHPGKVISNKVGDLRVKNLTPECITPVPVPVPASAGVFIRKCAECFRQVTAMDESILSWETMDFCNELCLSKYQKTIASNCSYCTGEVRANCLGKYAVRFGYDIRQFCSSLCLEEYKKGLKVCSYCQKDISVGTEGFLAPAGDKGQFKDFCSPICMDKYNNMNPHKQPVLKPGVSCSVCLKEVPISIEYERDGKMNLFCGEPCFVAYKFVNHNAPERCDMCARYFDFKVLEQHTIFYDNTQHSFCSKSCQNIYIIANRRIVPCSWCKVKKYNFDMIKRYSSNGQTLVMCSLNCLGLHQVSLNALSLKKTQCDHCMKTSQPMYHLTMSDATTRNFCSYACVMTFQSQFSKKPLTLNEPEGIPVPTGAPKRSRRAQQKELELPALPVISNVQSLAPITNGGGTAPTLPPSLTPRTTRSKANANTTQIQNISQAKHYVIIRPPPLPEVKNMMTMCKPVTVDQSVNTEKPDTTDKETQSDDVQNHPTFIPVPVPIYVPVPIPMMVVPYPSPTPFPLPVPVPFFIPTTRNSANGILKEIKKIQVKIPTDPFEAELLMMAEMVAGDKKEEPTDSESEEEDTTVPPDDPTFSPEPVDASNSFGDDMLQMALKMASELDEPAVDLEGALTASTITAPQGNDSGATEENVDDPQPMSQIISRQSCRGKKRAARGKGGPSKRGRRASQASEVPTVSQQQQPQVPAEPVEKPDANMCLKEEYRECHEEPLKKRLRPRKRQ